MKREIYIQDILRKLDSVTARLTKVEGENCILKEENQALKERVAELESQQNKNSNNSSKPPSSDGYRKKPAFPRKQSGKQGGQKGHKGSTLHQIAAPDEVVYCDPCTCSCGHEFKEEELRLTESRQVFDMPKPTLKVTEYQIYEGVCPACGCIHKGEAPVGVNAPAQYGQGVKAYVTMLNVHFKLPFKKIQLLFHDLFGYAINESTIYSATRQCYENLEVSEQKIKDLVAASQVAHADETGLRVKGKLNWLHTASTKEHTYLFVHEKRGSLALKSDQSILEQMIGWLVHDCWGSYFKFAQLKHAICGAHLIRELEWLVENHQRKWAELMQKFLLNLNEAPTVRGMNRTREIILKYRRLCQYAEEEEPQPEKIIGKKGRTKKTKGRNLLERLIREESAVLAFAFNEQVPFTNNQAERDIRPAKVKQKISNCFRTKTGADIYARIEGFISTARKQDRNVFSELCDTFSGFNFITK